MTDLNDNTNLVMDTTNYLNKEEYYKKTLIGDKNTILYNYHCLIVKCLKYATTNITKLKKKQLDFVLLRCYDTITHVFLNILLYTKNDVIVFLYCQKACYFYVEFVNQITDEQNNFLQLGSRDACIYVYKKIFTDINNEYCLKNMNNDENETYFFITEYTKLCKSILIYLTETSEPSYMVEQFKQLESLVYDYTKLNKPQIHLYANLICVLNDLFYNNKNNKNKNISNVYVYIIISFIKGLIPQGECNIEKYTQKLISIEFKEKIIELFTYEMDTNTTISNEFTKWFYN